MNRIADDRPRPHPYRFAHVSLRRIVIQEPERFAEAARREDFDDFLSGLWSAVGESLPPEDQVPSDGIDCHRYERDSRVIVVVTLPKPEHGAEAYFVAAVVAPDVAVRYFTLEHSWNLDGSARTVLAEWAGDTHLNMGTGPDPDEAAFLASVEDRLR